MTEHYVTHQGKNIAFTVVRKKVKNVNLRVCPDSTVVISANKKVPYSYIEQLVKDKLPWIIKTMDHFETKRSIKGNRKYITGEIIEYLGSYYPLKVIEVPGREEVIFDSGDFFLFVRDDNDPVLKEQLFAQWYKDQAKALFDRSLERMHPLVAGDGIEKPSITIRTMKTRWGSCSWSRQKITLNTELVKTPPECIDYVLLHELAHFKYHKHDASFYSYLAGLMPDWKERKQSLKSFSANLSLCRG